MRNIKILVDDVLVGEADLQDKPLANRMFAADRGDGLSLRRWHRLNGAEGLRWDVYVRSSRTRELDRDLPSPTGAMGIWALMHELFALHVDLRRFKADHEQEVEQRRKADELMADVLQ